MSWPQATAMIQHLPARLTDCDIYRGADDGERHLQYVVDLFLRGVLRRD